MTTLHSREIGRSVVKIAVGHCHTRETPVVSRYIVSERTAQKTPPPSVFLLRACSLATQYAAGTVLPSEKLAVFRAGLQVGLSESE
jgi:hypothetical protein